MARIAAPDRRCRQLPCAPSNDVVTSAPGGTLSGGCDLIVDGGLWPQPCVDGTVWEDLNDNGCREAGEPPQAGVDLTLVDSLAGSGGGKGEDGRPRIL